MKLRLITVLFLLSTIPVFSQSNFYKLGIGGGLGFTQSFTDVKKNGLGAAGYGLLDYYFTPFLSLGVEGQMGQITGGDVYTDPGNREFINDYKSFSLNGKVYLGGLIDYQYSKVGNALKGLYLGSGIGVIQNKMIDIARISPEGYVYPGKDKSRDILVPVNIGLNVYFPDRAGDYRYVVNFNFQSNLTFGEGLDGYDNTSVSLKPGSPDIYNYITVGFRYNLGPIGLSSKTFRRP